ncbi:MAG TPA: TonB-dependent receptor [Candidatus Acidoferrum sp.]|nr:TonB-dependent receptor [Candidatus Acidoferrum sp.]
MMTGKFWGTRGSAVLILFLGAILFFGRSQVSAQEAGGTIVGTITDPGGSAVAGAGVTIRNVATGVTRNTATSDDGVYVAPNLIPGTYEITVTLAGFATAVTQNVGLLAGERREVNVSMKIGQVSDKVNVVSSEISDVELASSEVRGVIDSHTVNELPLNGRDWTSLTLLEPGVAQVRTQKALGVSNDRANRGLGTDITIGGNRPQGNNYQLDGVSINDNTSGAPGSVTGGVLGVDAIQEFSVVTSNAPANYGKTSGGVINAASRSGTNTLHGSAYEFIRNSELDTRNVFDTLKNSSGDLVVPPFKRNQFGGSLGGPIFKDRTFFFADYEGLRQSLSQTTTLTVPSANAHNGILTTGNVTVSPLVAPYLALFPTPSSSTAGDTGTFAYIAKQVTNEDFATGRLDHRISASDNFFATFLWDHGTQQNPDAYNFKLVGNEASRNTLSLEESHIFTPTVVNTARFGFNRNVIIAFNTISAINPAATDTSLGFNPGLPAGIITVGSGVTQFTGGIGAISAYFYHFNSFQYYDDLFWTKNKHSIKMGFYAERIQDNQFTQGASPNGFYTFGSLTNFLTDVPSTFQTLLPGSRTPRDLRQTVYGGYIQDDYKIKPRLTLNLGLRYEMATVPTEVHNELSTLINLTDISATAHLGSPYFSNPTFRNFAPRVGFAWDPTGNGKTSVRGAFGIYDVLPLPYQFELLTLLSQPFTEASSVSPLPANSFPSGGFALAEAQGGTGLRNAFVEQNPHRSYVEQWTLNVQHEVARNLTVTAAYVGSHGVHLPFHADEINDFQPTLTPVGYLWPLPGAGTRLFPNLTGQVSTTQWSTSSTYHGLNLSATKRLSHGLQFQGSYTFSKSLDDGSSGIAGDTFGNSVSSLPLFDPRLRHGPSDFDVRHVAAISAIWMVPTPADWNGVPKYMASGWQIGGIYTGTSGLPFTPTIGGDPLGLGGADLYAFPNRVPGCDPASSNYRSNGLHYLNLGCFTLPVAPASMAAECKNFAGAAAPPPTGEVYCANLLGNSSRNSVYGPGLQDFDFSLFKNSPVPRISETFNIQFRWEVFNIFNHANFNPPAPAARQIFSVSGATNNAGILTSPTITFSRQMQFALKFIW